MDGGRLEALRPRGGRRGAHSAHKAGAMGPGFGLAGRGPMGPRPPNAAAPRGAGSPPRRRRPPGQEAQGAAGVAMDEAFLAGLIPEAAGSREAFRENGGSLAYWSDPGLDGGRLEALRPRGGGGGRIAPTAGAMGPGFGLAGRGPMGPRPPNAAAPPRRRKPTEATAAPWARSPGGRFSKAQRSLDFRQPAGAVYGNNIGFVA